MIILDDLLVRPAVGLLNVLHDVALEELYDIDAIEDDLKTVQLLYELGEIPESEYRTRKEELEAELEIARDVHESLSSGRVEVKR